MPNIQVAEDGAWIEVPADMQQNIVCCDCGNAHSFKFRLVKRRRGVYIQWQAFRQPELTEQIREEEKICIQKTWHTSPDSLTERGRLQSMKTEDNRREEFLQTIHYQFRLVIRILMSCIGFKRSMAGLSVDEKG